MVFLAAHSVALRILVHNFSSRRYTDMDRDETLGTLGMAMLYFLFSILFHVRVGTNVFPHKRRLNGMAENRMVELSPEQKLFVEDPEIVDGKLYAPPGSGKSMSIIRKHMFMIRQQMFRKNEIMIITFTRHSCRDIQDRILQYPNHTYFFDMKSPREVQNVRTIDALAFQVMKRWNKSKTDMVQILSPWLLQFLQQSSTTESMLRQTDVLRHTRLLFVDEAQDLNQIQYDIVMRLKDLLHLTVYLVGDPNQSIYGFRGSSPCYMIDFIGKEYHLSYNFRSTEQIVNFTEFLKPHKQYVTLCPHSSPGRTLPKIIHSTFEEFGEYLKPFIRTYPDDLSTIAILCPTKGNRVRSDGMICGLSRVSNMLEECKVPFIQSYQETSNHDETTLYETVPGHVNLLTFHGSKGKEWKTVICMDVWFELMNRVPTLREHADYQYLLYVAMTRAQRELVVYMGREKHPNPYLYNIPISLYDGFIYAKNTPKYTTTEDDRIYNITDVIDRMPPDLLLHFEPHIKYDFQSRSFYNDYRETVRKIVKNDFVLFGVFLENLFSMQCSVHKKHRPRTLRVIDTILSGETIYLPDNHFGALQPLWKSCQTWAEYDHLKSAIPTWIVLLVNQYFKRDVPWERHFLSCGKFYSILHQSKPYIQYCYDQYLDTSATWESNVRPLFYLTLVTYCYNNNHLFNIREHGKSKLHLLDDMLWDLFRDMNQYARLVASKPYEEQVSVRVPYLKMFGKLDLKFVDGTIMETKACQKLLSLPNIIQVMVYALADSTSFHDFVTRPIIMFNFITGEVANLRFNVSESSMIHIFSTLAQASNQTLQRVKMLFHVEMETPSQPIYLSIKDYKYNYYLVKDQYIKLDHSLSIASTMLTGITDQDLEKGIDLESLKQTLKFFTDQLAPTCVFIGYGDVVRKRNALQVCDLVSDEVEFLDGRTIAEVYGNQTHLTLNKASMLFLKTDLSHPVSGVVETTQNILQFLNYR